MVVKLKGPMQAIKSFLAASGRFRAVTIGEPFSPPEGLACAVLLESYEIPMLTLASTIEKRTVIVRIYVAATEERREDIEFLLDDAVSEVIAAMLGDFDLGGDIREIDPTGITVRFGFQIIAQQQFRVADISLPMTVDDSATLAK